MTAKDPLGPWGSKPVPSWARQVLEKQIHLSEETSFLSVLKCSIISVGCMFSYFRQKHGYMEHLTHSNIWNWECESGAHGFSLGLGVTGCREQWEE